VTAMPASTTAPTDKFRIARDILLDHRDDYATARREFRWPELDEFNWAVDWFDAIAVGNDRPALWIVSPDGDDEVLSFELLAANSEQVAAWLHSQGVRQNEQILLFLGNCAQLWEITLAAMRIGAVIIPATTLLGADELRDRVDRGEVTHVVAAAADTGKFADVPGDYTRIAVGEPVEGWLRYSDAYATVIGFERDTPPRADDPLLLYFTSGTSAKPKLVEHTQVSYPVGHLSTMYWIGLRPGDVHLNVSSPGWAKHAWSSVFAPWNAEATVLVVNQPRFSAPRLLDAMRRCRVTTFCAPPTVWRMLIQEDLAARRVPTLREVVSAGEPLNPEVIEQVRHAWGLTIRDGYGQTETTAQIGNTPGERVVPGSMGRPLPGYTVELIDPATGKPADEGEICLDLAARPLGLMKGYRDDEKLTAEVMRDGYYHTGDLGIRDADGRITCVGRADDVFKASDYRISPFELESVLIEHEAVAEAAIVPSPDPVRLSVPKAYVLLTAGHEPSRETALAILAHCRRRLPPYQRVRRLQFGELPKTISGKIRRVELRRHETGEGRAEHEYWEEDFPELKG
jgi:acetyl-CoA synthetase